MAELLNPALSAELQRDFESAWDENENPNVAWLVTSPPEVDNETDLSTPGTAYPCRVLPGRTATEEDTGDGVNVGDESVMIFGPSVAAVPGPGWRFSGDGEELGVFTRVDSDPAGVSHECWLERA